MSAERKPTRQARAFVTALTLAASLCVDMSRCGRPSSQSRARSACVLFLSILYPSDAHTISSYLLYPKVEAMEKATMIRVIRIVGATLSHQLCWSTISLHFLTEFIGELKDGFQRPLVVNYSDKADNPLQILEEKLDKRVRTQQHLKLTQSGL